MNGEPTVLYHLTAPAPRLAATEAVHQEVEALLAPPGRGEIVHLYPRRNPGTRIPRRWWGLQRLPYLRRAEARADLHHLFNPDPYPFPLLNLLRRPVIYTAVAGVGDVEPATARRLAERVALLVVPSEEELAELAGWGITNSTWLAGGIDPDRFHFRQAPAGPPYVVLAGSAPWTREQFATKGVDALIAAARRRPDLHLVFLWRGVLTDELRRRVRAAGIESRVDLLDGLVDVDQVLGRVHASVVLADRPALVKAYPHSLLESLAAGKPVLVSRALPMAGYVEAKGCGKQVDEVSADAFLAAFDSLLAGYGACQRRALASGAEEFGLRRVVGDYRRLYRQILDRAVPAGTSPANAR